MKKYRNGTELRDNASLPFSCQGENVWNRKLCGPQGIASSYLAGTEVYSVRYWKKGAGAYGFYTVRMESSVSFSKSLPFSDLKYNKSKMIKAVHAPLLCFQKPVFCTHSLGRKTHTAAKVGNEAASTVLRGPSSLKPETSAQC